MNSHESISPKQFAEAIGVSESSVKRWCDRGVVSFEKTAGGHRRIPVSEAVDYIRRTGRSLNDPTLLNLPQLGRTDDSHAGPVDRLTAALLEGDEVAARRIAFSEFLRNHSCSALVDDLFAVAMRRIGDAWRRGEIEMYVERRAARTLSLIVAELRSHLPVPSGPVACGATPHGNFHDLPSHMVEFVLRNDNWNATCLGESLPTATLLAAIRDLRPKFFWLSIADEGQLTTLQDVFRVIAEEMAKSGGHLVLGGGAFASAPIPHGLPNLVYCSNLDQLLKFANRVKFCEPSASRTSI